MTTNQLSVQNDFMFVTVMLVQKDMDANKHEELFSNGLFVVKKVNF